MLRTTLALSALLLAACGEDPDDHDHDADPQEVITSVILTFQPSGGGAPLVFEADDPDGDGGEPPTIDPINLPGGADYALAVAFENRLEDPAEDITVEVLDESTEHQVFFTGSAVNGPASDQPSAPLMHQYLDLDDDNLPIGLANQMVAMSGTGDLVVTLRHLPAVNDTPTKVEGLAEAVAAGGFAAIGGETDAQVTFAVTAGAPE